MLKIYFSGLCILVIAIISNVFAKKIGLLTWYDFGPFFFKNVLNSLKNISVLNILWLFFIYPSILSIAYNIGNKIYDAIS